MTTPPYPPHPGTPPGGQPNFGQQPGGYPGQPQYGPGGYGQPAGPPPNNNLVWGILTTILCCLPFGIVSIIKANQVSTLWAQGQFDEAHKSAADAKKWAMWAAISAVALWVIIIIIYVVIIAAAVSSVQYR